MSFKNTFQNIRQKIGRDSTHDWYGALISFALVLFVMLMVHVWMFVNLSSGTTAVQSVSEKKLISIDQADISKAIENTDQKNTGSVNVSGVLRNDPSL